MKAPIDFPTIADPAPSTSTAVATITSTVLAKINAVEPKLRALAEKYRAVVFDLKTAKGLEEAKAARHDLRENGRYAVQRAEKAVKDEVNGLKKGMADAVDRLVAIVQPTEDDLDRQIKVREAELEAEREAKRQAEENRKQAHRDTIAKIRSFEQRAKGLPAARIRLGIDMLEGINPGEEFEEFQAEALRAKDDTLAAMRKMLADAEAAEAEAARLEAQRQEQARVAAEQARVAAELAEKQRQLAEQAAELDRQRRAADEAAERAKAEADKKQREEDAKRIADQALQTAAAPSPAAQPAAQVAAVARQAPAEAPAASEPATLKLGVICERLGFAMTAAFVADTLGVQPAATEKAAKIYTESQYIAICKALLKHIVAVSAAGVKVD